MIFEEKPLLPGQSFLWGKKATKVVVGWIMYLWKIMATWDLSMWPYLGEKKGLWRCNLVKELETRSFWIWVDRTFSVLRREEKGWRHSGEVMWRQRQQQEQRTHKPRNRDCQQPLEARGESWRGSPKCFQKEWAQLRRWFQTSAFLNCEKKNLLF